MRHLISAAVIVFVLCPAVSAGFSWNETFEGAISPYWSFHSGSPGTIGVVTDPTHAGNKVLKVDSTAGGYAYGDMLVNQFGAVDSSQPVSLSFRFYLFGSDNSGLVVVGANFTAEITEGNSYGYGGATSPFTMPVAQWVTLSYRFVPNSDSGVLTHSVWLDGVYKGTFDNHELSHPGPIAFFLGDIDPNGHHGAALWDDFGVAQPPVPEPASLAGLAGGLGAILLRARRGRPRAGHAESSPGRG
jgi:hypothetical protein